MQLPLPFSAPEPGERVRFRWHNGEAAEGTLVRAEGGRVWVRYSLPAERWWFAELRKWVTKEARADAGVYSFLRSEHPELEVVGDEAT
jgi:hypothetical protein